MPVTVRRTTEYRCSLERAFQAPMLCDVTEVHTGFGPMPRVTHCTDDERWGEVGSTKRLFMAPTLGFAGGFAAIDRVLERVENERWTIEVSQFQMWMLGLTRFVGVWETTELAEDRIRIDYTYTLYGEPAWLAPARWLFAKTFYWVYMGRVLENVRRIATSGAPLRHARPR